MLAAALSLGVFVYWAVVGCALHAALYPNQRPVQRTLLAPVTGAAAVMLPVFLLNRAGIPVSRFALALTLGLLLLSLVLLWRIRPRLPLRSLWPFGGILLVAFAITGRPLFQFGFNWLSYSNDDMANYTLMSMRYIDHGFFEVPDVSAMLNGVDYSLWYWFFEVITPRPGGAFLLAWLASLTGLSTQQAYMPLILAAHLVLISAAAGLVYRTRTDRLAGLLTCALMSVSALTTLGTIYQLLPQVVGIAFLAATVALVCRPFGRTRRSSALRHGLLLALLGADIVVAYPEVLPFVGLGFLCYTGVEAAHRRLRLRSLPLVAVTAIAGGLLLINQYGLEALEYLVQQVGFGIKPVDASQSLFPYYLIPSGLPTLFGLQAVASQLPDPVESIGIAAGAALLAVSLLASAARAWKGEPVAIIGFLMLALALNLFRQRNDFGLFKIAMFVQPFLLGTLVLAWLSVTRRRATLFRVVPVGLLGLAQLPAQNVYIDASTRDVGRFIEVPYASQGRINEEFREILASSTRPPVVMDSANAVLAKFQALDSRGRSSNFASRYYFDFVSNSTPSPFISADLRRSFFEISNALETRVTQATFDWQSDRISQREELFKVNTMGIEDPDVEPCGSVVVNSPRQSIFNRSQFPPTFNQDFAAHPCDNPRSNVVVFTDTKIGGQYQSPSVRISLYQLENDILFKQGKTFAGVERYMLLQILNPSDPVRLVLELTDTLKADGENKLPLAAQVVGVDRQRLPFRGRGAARVVSPPVVPQLIDGRAYVGIDMGQDGTRFPDHRDGLMQLYGADVPLDRRALTGFMRNISAISEQDYQAWAAPARVSSFPDDLENPNLEYSGIYEDGWLANDAYFVLTQPPGAASLHVSGLFPSAPDGSGTTQLGVTLDGIEVARQTLQPGEFDLRVPVADQPGKHRVGLTFSDGFHLRSPDNRPAAARMQAIEFDSAGQ